MLLSQEGGVSSGFQRAEKDAVTPTRHLYHVSGRKHIRAIETDLTWDSFNTGDCFILDTVKVFFIFFCRKRSSSTEIHFDRENIEVAK